MGEGEGEGSCDNHYLISDLSEDVLIQILLWLPVISLLRFKSVCKSWRSIIQSPLFINLHHATTLLPSKLGGSSLFCCGYSNYDDHRVTKKENFFTLSGEEFEVFEDLGIPPTLKLVGENEIELYVVGCCNGLICLHDLYTRNVALWNPAIKQFRTLPKPSNLLGDPNCFQIDDHTSEEFVCYTSEDFVRFGIDIKTNDHKVLQITTFVTERKPKPKHSFDMESPSPSPPPPPPPSPSLHERRVHVYNLSTHSWRCITDDATLSTPHPYPDDSDDPNLYIKAHGTENQGLYLNGSYFFQAMYWTEEKNSWLMLLSFDFTAEIFTTIQQPYDLRNRYECGDYTYFIPFGEKLALVHAKKDQFQFYVSIYDIWVLNEQQQQHGVKESSWTKLYTIGSPDSDRSIERPLSTAEFAVTYSIQPLCITNNGEFAIIYGQYCPVDQDHVSNLKLLNLITEETKVLRSDYEDQTSKYVYVYKPCLVPIGENVSCST